MTIFQSFVIDNVAVYSRYSVSIAADNNYGFGPLDTRVVRTAEAKPSTPPIIVGTNIITGWNL